MASVAEIDGLTVSGAPPAVSAPAAAYSVRLLDSALGVPTYTGAAMRVRRDTAGGAGDDDEADIAFDSGVISLDSAISNASAGVTATTLGQFLNVGTVNGTTYTNPDSLTVTASCFTDSWYDQSGNANHAEQATHGSQPQIHDGTVNTDLVNENGKPALDFDGVSQELSTGNGLGWSTYPWTGITVNSPSSTNSGFAISHAIASSSNEYNTITQRLISGVETQAFQVRFGGGSDNVAFNVTGAFGQHLQIGQSTSVSNHAFYVNGSTLGTSTDTPTVKAFDEFYIGRLRGSSSALNFDGKMQEVVMYFNDQSSNRTGIEENINSDYLIYQPTDQPTSGLLYDYGSATGGTDAAAAYSVRQLSDKAILCMRIRRDMGVGNPGDDDETNIGFDSNGDLDTQAIADFCGTGTGWVTRWWDQSVNGNHADQAADASQPQIYNGSAVLTLNGKPYVNFVRAGSVTGTELLTPSTSWSTAGALEFFSVFQNAGGIGDQETWSNASVRFFTGNGANIVNTAAGNLTYTLGKIASQNLFVYEHNSTARTVYIDGTQDVTSASPANVSTTSSIAAIGRRYNNIEGHANVRYQELIHYPVNQSTNRTGIEENINSEYLIYQPTDAPTSGLLADYTGAAAAYSVRQLSDKAILCMRIRRDMGVGNPGDDDETNIGFDSNGDLDTQAIADFCGTGTGYVTRWWDQSVNGNHADQPVGGTGSNSSQPQIYNGTEVIEENGKPALSFDSDKLGPFTLAVSQPFTFNFVGRYAGDTASAFAPFFGSRDTTLVSFLVRGGDWMQQASSLPSNSTTVDTNQHNWFLLYDGSSSFVGVDGGTAATSNPGTSALENLAIGARGTDSAITELRYFQELVLWPSDQDGAGNRSGIETDTMTYYSIP